MTQQSHAAIHVHPELKDRLKIRAAEERRTIQAIVEELVIEYLKTPRSITREKEAAQK